MTNFGLSRRQILWAVQFLMLLQTNVLCYQHQVGDLHGWGVPSSPYPAIYTNWSQTNQVKIGDSLFFLYPPSQDSVIQVTKKSFDSCNLKKPILYMDDGNSLFNITSPGRFYFTSGIPGHCENSQKLQITVLFANGSALPPSYVDDTASSDGAPGTSPASSPSYPTASGSMTSASSSLLLRSLSSSILTAFSGATIFMIISSRI